MQATRTEHKDTKKVHELERRLSGGSPATRFEYVDVWFEFADRDVVVPHGLSPSRPDQVSYLPVQLNGPAVLYHDTSSTRRLWTASNIVLRSNTANTMARVLLMLPAEEATGEGIEGVGAVGTAEVLSALSVDQIAFPATQNASSDANTLDDYEEGSWTPALAFGGGTTGIAYTYQVGTYVKVGQQVTINGHITLSSKGSSTGAATLTGLPFSTDSTGNSYWVISVAYSYGMNAFTHPLIVLIGAGGTSGTFYQNGTYSAINNTHFQNTSQLIFQLTYRADN